MLLTGKQLAMKLNVHITTIRRACRNEHIPYERLGKLYFFDLARVRDGAAEGQHVPGTHIDRQPVERNVLHAHLAAAFDAYRATLGNWANDPEYVRQKDRQFFIGFARSWRGKYRDDALRRHVATNNHAPESYRIATVRNLDAWYDAFDVKPGQRFYLEPAARVRIW